MKNGKLRNVLIPDTKIYLWIIGILVAIMMIYNPTIAVISALVLMYLIYYNWQIVHEKKAQLKEYVENLSINIDAATQKTLLDLPFPFAILEEDGNIIWYNPEFLNMCEEKELLGEKINNLFHDMSMEGILGDKEEKGPMIKSMDGRSYQVLSSRIEIPQDKKSNKPIIMMYFLDQTQYVQMKEKYTAERPIIGFIQVDNYDDVMQVSSDSNRSLIVAAIDRKINIWAKEMDAIIKRYSDDKYLMIFENKHLPLLEEKRFDILDTVRDIQSGNRIPITLSIGIGKTEDDLSPLRSQEEANAALDIALGRGGDQAVVKENEKLSFYGGKSQAVEKRTKVKARVIAHALKQLIEQADQVFITGHRIPDLDSLGSSLGVYRACKALGKEAYIIFEESNPNVDILYKRLMEQGYEDALLKPEKAKKMADHNTLLVVCDTHRPSFTEDPELIEILDRVVVIDHHRRASEFVEDPILTYLEPYASSTSELVTEVLQYIVEKISLEPVEADALLAGIFIDTKHFTFKTGVRTFEAASYLRRKGADTVNAKQLFQNDMSTFIAKAEAVKNAQVFREKIAISVSSSDVRDATLIAAQTADELLNIHGIIASFVLTKYNDQVFISGRSLGKVNVQVILEKLGGGGHLAVAGAQLLDVDSDEAVGLLKNAIDEYIKEDEDS